MAVAFDTPITTNDQSVDRVLKAGLPVVLVFLNGAQNPAPEGPLERLARANAGSLLVAKIHIKDNPETARRYGIKRPPAVVALRDGQVQSQAEAITGEQLEQHAAYLLGKGPKPQPKPAPEYGQTARPSYTSGAGARSSTGASQPGAEPRTVTDATFEQEVLRSNKPSLVDFWAPWCGPCRMVEPVVEKLAQEMGGRLNVAKVNVDENPVIAQRYDVRSIPTMMVVKNGQIVDRWMGALPEAAIRSRVAPHVN